MNRHFLSSTLLVAMAFLSVGCEPRYADFGEELDVVEPIEGDVVTFIRTNSDGLTTLLTIEDPSGGGGQMIFGFLEPTTETTLITGTYQPSGTGEARAHFTTLFHYPWEPSVPVISRVGSTRDDVDIQETIGFELVGEQVRVTVAGEEWTFELLDNVVALLDLSTQGGVEALAQVYNLTILSNQARILGFGGAGMTQYVGSPGNFLGLIDGAMSVSVASLLNPKATLRYDGFEDVAQLSFRGDIITNSNISGNGPMEGVVDFQYASPADGVSTIVGACDYANLRVANGLAASGHYAFTLDSGMWDVDWTVLANMDLRWFIPPTP